MFSTEQYNSSDGEGELHYLESKKSSVETYKTFYQLYNPSELKNRGYSTILNRVLHIDETNDRSTHFVIAKADAAHPRIREHYNRHGVPAHTIPYSSRDLLVASTDGTLITEFDVISAHGMYGAMINETDKRYDPYFETMELSLIPSLSKFSINNLIRAEFNVGTGCGTVAMGERPCAWVLSDAESTRIRNEILEPECARDIGHTAIASA